MQELRQTQKMTLQLTMTPQLQMSIKLLQLSRMELIELVQQEMQQNPVLDETLNREAADEVPVTVAEDSNPPPISPTENEVDFLASPADEHLEQYAHDSYSAFTHPVSTRRKPFTEEEENSLETFVAQKTTLCEHLIWQLKMAVFSEEERRLGAHIIYSLDDDGYLRISEEELAEQTQGSLPLIKDLMSKIQTFDPVGVGARNLKECLLIQARFLGYGGSIVEEIILNCLPELENRNFVVIAKKLKSSVEHVSQAFKIICEMEPKPGRPYSGEAVQYITPDIYVYKVGDDYKILLNDQGIPQLQISDYYRDMADSARSSSRPEKEYLQEKIRSASWLIKSIERRRDTIYRVMESIIKFQRDFFDKGVEHLRPLVLREVAEDLNMHESTISRVTTNKYAYTPQGIFELKYFFSSGISRLSGEDIASETVKEKIREIIKGEDSKQPLSDQNIVALLKKQDIDIARRTVAKYRETLGILPSSKRRKLST